MDRSFYNKLIRNYVDQVSVDDEGVFERKGYCLLAWQMYCKGNGHLSLLYDKVKDILLEYTECCDLEVFSLESVLNVTDKVPFNDKVLRYVIDRCCINFNNDCFNYNELHSDALNVGEFLVELAEIKSGNSVYLPFSGFGNMALSVPNGASMHGSENDDIVWALLQMRLWVYGKANVENFVKEDSFREMDSLVSSMGAGEFQGYDRIVMTPPACKRMAEDTHQHIMAISSALKLLKENGTIVVALPAGVVSENETCAYFEELIKRKCVSASLFIPTPDEYLHSDGLVILLLDKKRNDVVRFCNCVHAGIPSFTEQYLSQNDLMNHLNGCLCTSPEVDDNCIDMPVEKVSNGKLLPSIYLVQKDHCGPSYIVENIGNHVELADEPVDAVNIPYPVLRASDLGRDWFDCDINSDALVEMMPEDECLSELDIPFLDMTSVHESVYLYSFNAGNPVVGKLVIGKKNKEVLLDKDIIPFRIISKEISKDVLLNCLLDEKYFFNLEIIAKADNDCTHKEYENLFLDLKVAYLPLEIQKEELLTSTLNELKRERKEKKLSMEKQIVDIRLRKHSLISVFCGYKERWKKLRECMRKNGGVLKDEDKPTRTFDYTVEEWMDIMELSLETMEKNISSITMLKDNFRPAELFHPDSLIKEYCRQNPSAVFRYSSGTPVDSNEKILISKDAMFRVLGNIVSNALSHGFKNTERTDYQIRFQTQTTEDRVIITIANNGSPIPESMKGRDLFQMGLSSSFRSGDHEGLGCYDVRNILSLYDAECEIVSKEVGDFKVVYRLYFKRQNRN